MGFYTIFYSCIISPENENINFNMSIKMLRKKGFLSRYSKNEISLVGVEFPNVLLCIGHMCIIMVASEWRKCIWITKYQLQNVPFFTASHPFWFDLFRSQGKLSLHCCHWRHISPKQLFIASQLSRREKRRKQSLAVLISNSFIACLIEKNLLLKQVFALGNASSTVKSS